MNAVQLQNYNKRLSQENAFGYLQIDNNRSKIFSSILQDNIEDQQIQIHIQLNQKKTRSLKINTQMKVAQLIQQIKGMLREEKIDKKCAYLQCVSIILYPEATLGNYQINEYSLIKIVENVDIHLQIKIKLYGFEEVLSTIPATNTTKIHKIKEIIAQKFNCHIKGIHLFYGTTQQLQNQYSLADLGILNDELLTMKYMKPSGFLCKYLNMQSVVSLNEKNYNKIIEMKFSKAKTLLSYDTGLNKLQQKELLSANHAFYHKFTRVQLQKSKDIICTEDNYLFTGLSWKSCSQQSKYQQKLQIGDSIMLGNNSSSKVVNIYYNCIQNDKEMIDFEMKNNEPLFINDILVRKSFNILIIYKKQGQHLIKQIQIGHNRNVQFLKKIIQERTGVQKSQQYLYFKNKLLKDEIPLSQINSRHSFIILFTQKIQIQNIIKKQKIITIKFQNEIKHVIYHINCEKNMKDIIQQLFSLKLQLNKIYGLLYNKMPIPNRYKLKEVIQMDSKFYQEDHTIMVVRCVEKFIIKQLFMIQNQIKKPLKLLQYMANMFSRIFEEERLIDQYKTIMRDNKIQFGEFLESLRLQSIGGIASHRFCRFFIEIIDLFRKDKFNQKFRNKCFKIMPGHSMAVYDKNNYVISSNFMSCTSNENEIIKISQKFQQNITILTINSITGKKKSNEIIFLPFTYYKIKNIELKEKICKIQLLQMPSPICFDKNLVIWVDDKPHNNSNYLRDFPHEAKIQVLQLISTDMALTWFDQFISLVSSEGIRIKVASDLVRKEVNLATNRQEDRYAAGVDLAELLFNKNGFTTPIFILSTQYEKGLQLIEERQISKNRICTVSNSVRELLKYMSFS